MTRTTAAAFFSPLTKGSLCLPTIYDDEDDRPRSQKARETDDDAPAASSAG